MLGRLQAMDSVSQAFNLCCPWHKETGLQAFQPEGFARLSPEGGCQLACDRRLDCGHRCESRCHSESMHEVFACRKPCERLHSACNHLCQQLTYGEDCMVELGKVLLSCGHTNDKVPCYLTQDLRQVKCSTLVQRQVPGCNHIVGTECSTDVTLESFRCLAPCSTILHCGHVCPGSCFKCNVKARNGDYHKTHCL